MLILTLPVVSEGIYDHSIVCFVAQACIVFGSMGWKLISHRDIVEPGDEIISPLDPLGPLRIIQRATSLTSVATLLGGARFKLNS